jgi:hypothetical protein
MGFRHAEPYGDHGWWVAFPQLRLRYARGEMDCKAS